MCALVGALCGRAGDPGLVRRLCPPAAGSPAGSSPRGSAVRTGLGPKLALCVSHWECHCRRYVAATRTGAELCVSGGTRTRFSYLSAAVCLFLYLVRCTLHSLHRKAARPVYPVPSRAGHQD